MDHRFCLAIEIACLTLCINCVLDCISFVFSMQYVRNFRVQKKIRQILADGWLLGLSAGLVSASASLVHVLREDQDLHRSTFQ